MRDLDPMDCLVEVGVGGHLLLRGYPELGELVGAGRRAQLRG